MRARCTAFLAAILLCVGATCPWVGGPSSQEPEEADVSEATEEDEPLVVYDPDEPAVERRRRAIAHLEFGREEEARAELAGVLAQFPSDARARDLMLQIDATPEEYFAPAFHGTFSDHQLRYGSSLSGVAKECLGDSLKFYALWKLNRDNPNVAQPNQVEGATTIRIPGPPCARKAEPVQPPGETPEPVQPSGETPEPVQPPEKTPEPVQPSEEARVEMLDEIDAAIGSRAYKTALSLIEKAEAQYGAVPEVVSRRERACREYAPRMEKRDPSRAAELYVCVGDSKRVRAKTVDEKLEVLHAFERAAELDPSGEGPSRVEKARGDLKREVNRLHTEALRAMRAGDCEKASSLWRKALQIDPTEEKAQAGLSRCRYQGPQ